MKAVLVLTDEDINTIIYEHFSSRGFDPEVRRTSNAEYEVMIDNWSMESFK